MYHRDYQVRELVEIRIYPDSITILNYGGPDRSIKMKAFEEGVIKPRRYRNRRLGDFLKELDLTEGRATGIPTIRKALLENGSPLAIFDTDDDRSFFEVTIPVHPAFGKKAKSGAKGGAKGGAKSGAIDTVEEDEVTYEILTLRQKQVLEIIKEFPAISYREVAQRMGINHSAVQRHFENLKKKGLIKRIGPAKGGYWHVLDR